MEQFKEKDNLSRLILGTKKMLNDKLNIKIEKEDKQFFDIINQKIDFIQNNYKFEELKKLNNIFLTHIKNYYINTNINNNINNINNKIDNDYIDLKVKEIEIERNNIINNNFTSNIDKNYNYPLNTNDNNTNDNNTNYSNDNNTYDNIITPKYNFSNFNNIIFKTFFINNFTNINIKNNNTIIYDLKNLNININNFNFLPQYLYLPNFYNDITPIILIKINKKTYNFICKNTHSSWSIWKTKDNFNIDINENYLNIEFFDMFNYKLNISNDIININKYLIDTKNKIIKLWFDNKFNYFKINNYISLIDYNNNFHNMKIIDFEFNNLHSNNLIILSYNINDNLNLNNSKFIFLNNNISLFIKYYTK